MDKRKSDKIFLEFPLCCLSYNDERLFEKIISYSVVKYSHKIDTATDKRAERLMGKDAENLDEYSIKIFLAAEELKVTILSLSKTIRDFEELSKHVSKFEVKFGKDAYCRIGRTITFETIDGQFTEENYRILCAIQSILGKTKPFVRITLDRIRYRMWGYKSKSIYLKENPQQINLLTDKKLSRRINLLNAKAFFSKFTYRRRQTFYSTKLVDAELRKAVKNLKIFWQKRKLNIGDDKYSKEIKRELDQLNASKIRLKIYKKSG